MSGKKNQSNQEGSKEMNVKRSMIRGKHMRID